MVADVRHPPFPSGAFTSGSRCRHKERKKEGTSGPAHEKQTPMLSALFLKQGADDIGAVGQNSKRHRHAVGTDSPNYAVRLFPSSAAPSSCQKAWFGLKQSKQET